MSPRQKHQLLRSFAEWASEQRLTVHRHEAQFRGRLRDTPVEIETGIRDSDLYTVVVMIHFACGHAVTVLRSGGEARPEDSALVSRLRAILRDARSVLSIRLDETIITVRMELGSSPAAIGEVLDAVLSAVHATGAEVGPYR